VEKMGVEMASETQMRVEEEEMKMARVLEEELRNEMETYRATMAHKSTERPNTDNY
tara:strand:- start:802 stop:969 length:168 start_codon:yes stop_codon:yes gene_type:complete